MLPRWILIENSSRILRGHVGGVCATRTTVDYDVRELDPQTLPISCALPLSETAVSAAEVGPEGRGIYVYQ